MSAGGGKSAKVLKVLYIHGFEESVDVKTMSRKPKSLSESVRASINPLSPPAAAAQLRSRQEDLDVLAPELLVWMWQWNSPILQMFMTRYFHVAIFFACARLPPSQLGTALS